MTSPFVPGLVTQGNSFEESIAIALDAEQAVGEARAELQRRRQPTA